MEDKDMCEVKQNHGRKLRRMREILGVQQENLAADMGISQTSLHRLEQKDSIEDEILQKAADALKIPIEAIKNFSEEATINFVANTFSGSYSNGYVYICNVNPLDKIIELYERIIELEREKNKAE